jgi:hypothetical protein
MLPTQYNVPADLAAQLAAMERSHPSLLAVQLPPASMASSWKFTKIPSKALSDGPNQIPLSEIETVLRRLVAIHEAAHPGS